MGKLRSLVPSTSQCTVAINQFKRDRSANRMRFDDAELDELARGAHFFPTLRIALPDDRWTQPPSEDDRGSSPRHDDDELSAAARVESARRRGDAAVARRRSGRPAALLRAAVRPPSATASRTPDPPPSIRSAASRRRAPAALGSEAHCAASQRRENLHAMRTTRIRLVTFVMFVRRSDVFGAQPTDAREIWCSIPDTTSPDTPVWLRAA